MKKPRFLITAGPTREYLDPVRYISNASSGKMGYALAAAARKKSAQVVLIAGPTSCACPASVKVIPVVSGDQMFSAVMKAMPSADIFISAAAVSDYKPVRMNPQKIKKTGKKQRRGKTMCTVTLVENPDILKEVSRKYKDKVLVGFSLETQNLTCFALKKLKEKKLDLVVANYAEVIGRDITSVLILGKDETKAALVRKSKAQAARRIVDEALRIWHSR